MLGTRSMASLLQRRTMSILLSNKGSLNRTVALAQTQQSRILSSQVSTPPSHAKLFLVERAWALGMLPLFPASLFVQGTAMDYALAVAIALHTHWGLEAVLVDYCRPIIVGETFPKIAKVLVTLLTAAMFASMLHFNYSDVGITKGFAMIWSL